MKTLNIKQILAVAEKETKLNFRFKFNYFVQNLFETIKSAAVFILIYLGFFSFGAKSIGEVSPQNFVAFLLLGVIASTICYKGYYMFRDKFTNEKYWETISSLFISPLKKINLVIGVCLAELAHLLFLVIFFLVIVYLFYPTAIINVFAVFILFIIFFFMISSFGLIYGIISISLEQYSFLFILFYPILVFFSGFYYPIDVIPGILRIFSYINPVYYTVTLIRNIWLTGIQISDITMYFIPIIAFTIIIPIIAILLFN